MTGALQSGKRLGTDYWLGQRAVIPQTAWLAPLGYVSPQDWLGSPCQAAGCQMVIISHTQSWVGGPGAVTLPCPILSGGFSGARWLLSLGPEPGGSPGAATLLGSILVRRCVVTECL